MTRTDWATFTATYDDASLELINALRSLALRLPDTEEQVNRTEVSYARKRIFASAYVKSHWLELGVHLLREVEHPQLRTSFASSKRVTTHRLTIGEVGQIDESIAALLREAAETVGPGLR